MQRPESCCDYLHGQVIYYCDKHENECPNQILKWSENQGYYFLIGRNANYICEFCPWCGKELPKDLNPIE